MSRSDGEHDWSDVFRVSAVPDLLAALAGCETEEILDLLQRRYAKVDSDELERRIREQDSTVLRKFRSWPV